MTSLLFRITLMAAAATALNGCGRLYKEDMENCYGGVSVAVRIDPSMTDAYKAEQAAQSVIIYAFAENGRFLERRVSAIAKVEHFSHRDAGQLQFVGWVNKVVSFRMENPLDASNSRGDGHVTLSTFTTTRADMYHNLPTDLFHGEVVMTNARTGNTVEHKDILAHRLVGQATVTVRGLKEYAHIDDDNYYISTAGTATRVDFSGQNSAFVAKHKPEANFAANKDFVTGNFNLLPTETGVKPMTLEVWHTTAGQIHSTTKVAEAQADIHIVPDQTTNVLIDFTGELEVSVEQSQWGVAHSWKTFN